MSIRVGFFITCTRNRTIQLREPGTRYVDELTGERVHVAGLAETGADVYYGYSNLDSRYELYMQCLATDGRKPTPFKRNCALLPV